MRAPPRDAEITDADAERPETVVARLVAFLKYRRYEPGDRLPSERDLAERLGVSRNTVREALVAMESLRLVERRRNSGIYLRDAATESSIDAAVFYAREGAAPLDPWEVRQVMEVRRAVELLAAELAARRHNETDLERLRDNLARTAQRIDAGQSIEAEDRDFHMALARASRNAFLVRIVNSICILGERGRRLHFADPAKCRESLAHHRIVLEGIAAGDVAASRAAMDRHLGAGEAHWLGDAELLTPG